MALRRQRRMGENKGKRPERKYTGITMKENEQGWNRYQRFPPLFPFKILRLFELRILFWTETGVLFEDTAEMGQVFMTDKTAYRIYGKIL